MRSPSRRACKSVVLAGTFFLLAGCDMHDKAWETDSDARSMPTATLPASSAAGEVSVSVTANGTIACRVNGSVLDPVPRAAALRGELPASGRLLIVLDSKHDTESCFAVGFDLDALDTSVGGSASLRHVRHNIVIETDGPATVTLTAPRLQATVDQNCQFAADGDVDLLADRLNADPELIDGRDSEGGRTALMRASEMGRVAVVQFLLDRRANTEIKDDQGHTALHRAVSRGRLDVVKRLVKNGADVNARTSSGDTPMRLAWKQDRTQITSYLASVGAKPEDSDKADPK